VPPPPGRLNHLPTNQRPIPATMAATAAIRLQASASLGKWAPIVIKRVRPIVYPVSGLQVQPL
jgi:hypothetical protein